MTLWFLEQWAYDELELLRSKMDAAAIAELKRNVSSNRSRSNGMLIVDGSTARIPINGILTDEPDFFAELFGGGNTTYPDIVASLDAADKEFERVVLEFGNSPGGKMDGLFPTMDRIKNMSIPVIATVQTRATSAAYGLASQAGEIVALHESAEFGSVGVAIRAVVDSQIVDIASTDAPRKRPDLSTDDGKAVVREELDEIHEMFASAIADGRGTTAKKVNKTYGRGGTLLAKRALAAGMIDRIGAVEYEITTAAEGGGNEGGGSMDPKKLQAEHPDVYAAIVAIGVAQERDRVMAHVTLAEQTGADTIALRAIREGSDLTQTLIAEYTAAGLAKRELSTRVDDNPDTGSVSGQSDTPSLEAAIAARLDRRLGGVM